MYKFVFINIMVIFLLSLITNKIYNKKNPDKKKTYKEFIVGQKMSHKDILVGLSFGIIFGFLDNIGLIIGIEEITKNFKISNTGRSALGNTYSDFIGATVGTFLSIILKETLDYNKDVEEPIWLNTMGIVIGCLLGFYVPRLFKRRYY